VKLRALANEHRKSYLCTDFTSSYPPNFDSSITFLQNAL